jgi:hypothetical protein
MKSRTAALAAIMLFTGPFALAQLRVPADALQQPAQPAAPKPPDPATADKEQAARLAAQGWLVLLDRRDWGRAWETTSPIFRGIVPLGTWMDGIPKVREPLGAFGERKIIESVYKTSLEGHPPGEYVSVIFESRFANRPSVVEVITSVLDKDGRWRVTGYSAQ